jgi:hypothetical protein
MVQKSDPESWHELCNHTLSKTGVWPMLWIGILIGIFLGANFGIVVITMCAAANKGDQLQKATK